MKKEIFYTDKDIKDVNIALLSDIHYSRKFNVRIFDKIEKQIRKIKPDYIFIVGDLIDSVDVDYDNLYKYLKRLEGYAPIFIVLGNHDIVKIKKRGKDLENVHYNWLYVYNDNLRMIIKKLDRTIILDNDSYIDKENNISISGFSLSYEYYYKEKESYDCFMRDYREAKLKVSFDSYNILLVHTPYNVYEDINNVPNKELANFNLILSGHMHAGLVHPLLGIFFGKNGGLISPSSRKRFFPKYARGRVDTEYFSGYIYEGITKLSLSSGGNLRYLDGLFPKIVKHIKIVKR